MAMDPLLDGHGRRIGDLRVSVTDRCNFRCQYCMPAEGLAWMERDEALDLLEAQHRRALEPRQPLRGHAVLAAEVAAVCDREP